MKLNKIKKWQYGLSIIAIIFIVLAVKAYSLFRATWPIAIPHWQVSNEVSTEKVNHQPLDDLLSIYVTESPELREVNYSGFTQQDKQKLTRYLQYLQSLDPRNFNKNEQLAYWVNLYNGLIIKLILDNYPVTSVRKIGDGFTGPWNIKLATIAGESITLNKIEHGILRPIWQDNRIHYVINCASIGCPDLPLVAFSSDHIDQQLNTAAMRFVSQRKGLNIANDTMTLSGIYTWFSDDFGDSTLDTLNHIKKFATAEQQQAITQFSGDVEFDYNWGLNEK